ncbi:hypothetical protein EG831_03630 [bacterium]|nr:hypothetical protein [bacterium]
MGPLSKADHGTGAPRRVRSKLQLALEGVRQSGYTTYQIHFPWGPYVGNSRLDFPLDGYGTAIKAAVQSRSKAPRRLECGLEMELALKLSDPAHAMTDSDWVSTTVEASNTGERYVISATTSSAEARAWGLTIIGTASLPFGTTWKAGGLLGYRYIRMSYDIYGVTGWQDTTGYGDLVYFDELHDTRVLEYRVSYLLPLLGILVREESASGPSVQLRAARILWASANDEDRHLLRNKQSIITADAGGWLLEGGIQVRLATLARGAVITLAGRYEYLAVNAEGDQVQTYYGDDPYFAGDETGQSIRGIDATLYQRRHTFGLTVIYTF